MSSSSDLLRILYIFQEAQIMERQRDSDMEQLPGPGAPKGHLNNVKHPWRVLIKRHASDQECAWTRAFSERYIAALEKQLESDLDYLNGLIETPKRTPLHEVELSYIGEEGRDTE